MEERVRHRRQSCHCWLSRGSIPAVLLWPSWPRDWGKHIPVGLMLAQEPEKFYSCFFFPRASLPHSNTSACLHKSSPAAFFTASWKSEMGGRGNQIEDADSQLFYTTSSAGHSTKVEASSVVGVFIQPQGLLKSENRLDSLL